jgi:hypothetical protein
MKLEFSWEIFEKYSNRKFHKNLLGGRRIVLCGRTGMTKLIVSFRNFSNSSKNTFLIACYYLCPNSKLWKKVSSSNEILQKGEQYNRRWEGLNDPQVDEIVKNLAQGLWRHAFSLSSLNSCLLLLTECNQLCGLHLQSLGWKWGMTATNSGKRIPFIFNDESTGSCICLRLDLYMSRYTFTFWHGYVLHEGITYKSRVPRTSQMTSRLLSYTAAAMRAHNVLCKL